MGIFGPLAHVAFWCNGHGREPDQRQHKKGVHIAHVGGLLDRLLFGFPERTAVRDETVRHPMQRILILHARWDRLTDEAALMKR